MKNPMKSSRFIALAFAGVFAFLLTACIEVDNIGTQWETGTIDPALEGSWLIQQSTSESPQNVKDYIFVKAEAHYRVAPADEQDDPMVAKTLDIGGVKFLLLRDQEDVVNNAAPENASAPPVDGALWRYSITESGEKGEKKTVEFLRLKPGAAAEIEKISGGLLVPRQAGDTSLFAISTLDETALAALVQLSANPQLWEVWAAGEKAPPPDVKK